jgi:hypothetical protein
VSAQQQQQQQQQWLLCLRVLAGSIVTATTASTCSYSKTTLEVAARHHLTLIATSTLWPALGLLLNGACDMMETTLSGHTVHLLSLCWA